MRTFLLAIALTSCATAQTDRRAPDLFKARIETSKGIIVLEVHRAWSPLGVDRFYTLATSGYFNDTRFFRAIKGRWAQFGINGDPAVSAKWRARNIPDEPRRVSNTRGTVAFAFALANGRTTQVFINLADNANLDATGFSPFGFVSEGMDVVDKLNQEYGQSPDQSAIQMSGGAYLTKNFPRLDKVVTAVITEPVTAPAKPAVAPAKPAPAKPAPAKPAAAKPLAPAAK